LEDLDRNHDKRRRVRDAFFWYCAELRALRDRIAELEGQAETLVRDAELGCENTPNLECGIDLETSRGIRARIDELEDEIEYLRTELAVFESEGGVIE